MKKIVLLAAMAALTAGFATAQTTGKDRLKELEEKAAEVKQHKKANTAGNLFSCEALTHVAYGWHNVEGDAFRSKFGPSGEFFFNAFELSFNPASWLSLSAGLDLGWNYYKLNKDNYFDVLSDNSLDIIAAGSETWKSSKLRSFDLAVPAIISLKFDWFSLRFGAEAVFPMNGRNTVISKYSQGGDSYDVRTKGGELEKSFLRYLAVIDFDGLGIIYKYCPEAIVPGSEMIKSCQTLGIILSL